MQKITKYPAGTFSWIDLMTTDQAGAEEFYSQLFGWSINDMPIDENSVYSMFQLEGLDVAAAGQMGEDMLAQGVPPHWNNYITVDDVDAMTEKATSLGGTVVAPPFDVFDAGRMSVVQDPTGAAFSMWQAGTSVGAHLVNAPGSLLWNELATKDTAQAEAFYKGLFGWETKVSETNNGVPYTMWFNNDRPNGGMLQMTEEWGEMPSHWMVYFNVTDIEATMEKVTALGGKVHFGPIDAGEVGRFSVLQDPQGGVFTAMQTNMVDPIPDEWTA